MVSKEIIKEIDRTIKQTWVKNITKDYKANHLLKEGALKSSFYYHLRRKLAKLLEEYNLRIYPEFYFSELNFFADLAIVQIDPDSEASRLSNKVTDVIAVIELKYAGGNSERTSEWIKQDIFKMKDYIQIAKLNCQFYLAVIYETECYALNWMDGRSTNHWAKGYVTELNAGYIEGKMKFEVNAYNGINSDL